MPEIGVELTIVTSVAMFTAGTAPDVCGGIPDADADESRLRASLETAPRPSSGSGECAS